MAEDILIAKTKRKIGLMEQDMTESITRCPKCKTSFRVSTEHLKTARGAVRCGSCLNIFNAKEHLISSQSTEKTANSPIKESIPSSKRKPDDDDILISDDMLLDDDTHGEAENKEDDSLNTNVFIAKTASKTEINLFERRIKDAEDNDRDHVEADESWALNLLEDDKEEPTNKYSYNLNKRPSKAVKPTSEKSQSIKDDAETDSLEEPEETYSSIFQVIEEEEDKRERGLEPFPEDMLNSENKAKPEYATDEFFDDSADDDYNQTSNTEFFESFEPEPLELHVKNHGPIWDNRSFWMSLSGLALVILVFQAGYFNFDNWGRQDRFRPYYGQFCKLVGCTLPILQDLNQIKIDNMVVIDHPQNQGMLLVDATIQNRAKFDQYFPTLMLTFTDLNNALVSKMNFRPSDYVGGELAGRKLMPAKHPIHITLEIQDPGVDAVNYQISIVKP